MASRMICMVLEQLDVVSCAGCLARYMLSDVRLSVRLSDGCIIEND